MSVDVATRSRSADFACAADKTEVFDGLDLDIPRGQITGLMGPSGCGKTTLMRSIVGVQMVAGGTVTVLGDPAGHASLSAAASRTTPRRRRSTAT